MATKQSGKSIKKKVFRFVLNLMLVMLSFPLALTFLFRDPMVQTLSARMITNLLTTQIGHEVRIERMKINFNTGISLFGFYFKDHRGETLIRVDQLHAKPVFGEIGLLSLRFKKLDLEGVEFRYARYKDDKDFNLIMLLDRFSLRDTLKTKPPKKSGDGFKVRARTLLMKDAVFHFYDEHKNQDSVKGMNYADMRFEKINLYAQNFKLIGDSLNLIIDSLSTTEQSGLVIEKLSAHFIIARSGLFAKGAKIELPRSTIDLDLEFRNKSYKTFSHFIDSVYMYGLIRPSTIDMSEIGYFADQMNEMKNVVGITGEVSGPIRDMRGKNIRAHFGKNTRVHADVRITGLPDFFSSEIDANIFELSTTACELRSFRLPDNDDDIDYTEEFGCDDIVSARGTFNGSFYNFKTKLLVKSRSGTVDTDVAFAMQENDTIYFHAKLKGDTVNIGRILQQDEILGNVNLDLTVDGYGNSTSDLYVSANGLFKSFDLLDYRYSRMRMNGSFYQDTLKAHVRFGDHNLMMDVDGYLKLAEVPVLFLNSWIKKANIDDIGFWPGSDLTIKGNASVMMSGFDLNTTELNLDFADGNLDFGGDVYTIRHLLLNKIKAEDGTDMISLESDIADLSLKGKYRITELPSQLIEALNSYYNFMVVDEPEEQVSNEYADLNLKVKKTNLLQEQFLPGVELSAPLLITGSFNNDENRINLSSDPEKIMMQGVALNYNKIRLDAQRGMLNFSYDIADVIMKDSTIDDKNVFGMDAFSLKVSAAKDSLNFSITWENRDSLQKNSADVKGYLATIGNTTRFKLLRSDIYVNDTLWTVNPENLVVNDTSGLYFHNLDIFGGSSMMTLSGKYPRKENDQLTLTFDNWKLSNFDFITEIYNIDLDGIANGDLEFGIVANNPAIVSDLTIDSLHLNKEYLGTARLLNTWDNVNNSIFVKSQIVRQGNSGRGLVFSLDGYYYPFREKDAIDLTIQFNRLHLKAIEPLVAEFVTHLEGQVSGNLLLKGTEQSPVLTGKVDMHRIGLKVNYLNTKYSFSNEISFKEDQINFDELVIFDTLGNYATVDGSLSHQNFKNSKFDVKISTDKLLFFNTTRKMNDIYYGTAITSGNILVSGSPSKIKLGINVKTKEGTDVTLPLDYSLEISDKDYIIFVDHKKDTSFIEIEPEGKAKNENLSYVIDLGMEIEKEARVRIFLPSDMGRIESQGNGNLFLHANSTGDLTLRGDYVVESGIFHFSLGNLVSKRFELVRGGRISWTGDPYEANLSIKGLYRVRTNLSSLGIVVDSASDYKNKVNVNCYVILKNKLMNPDIRFEILFPNLDPDLTRRIYAVLDTTNLAVLNEQMISLLVLGSFSASNASNISLASSYYSVLTNQLSSMLSKISDDFDVGINYKPGDQVSQEEFELALSTQLFDDRLIIDGQFGMTYDRAQQNASNIVGEVDIGYKLTEDGRWILKVFNHSNVNSWNSYNIYEPVSPYTQGVGIAFRKEFTNIAELFKRTRPRKKDKARREEDEEIENL